MAKLMFIAPSAYVLGGVQVWLDYLVHGLINHGHQISVGLVAGDFHDTDKYLKAHAFSDVQHIHNATGSAEGRIRSICKAIARTRPNLVLSVNIADVYPAAARLKQQGHDIRVAMTLHGIQADFFEDVIRYRNVLDGVVCTNKLVLNLLLDSGFERSRIRYAPYGVVGGNPANEEAISGGPLRIAYVGRFDQAQKRVLDIPGILQRLDSSKVPYELRLAGAGPAERELRLQLTDEIEGGKVSFMGKLPAANVPGTIYRWADLLLLTSSWETGPIVIWEAMSHGVAVVTSSYLGSNAEKSLQNQENCLIFPVGDCEAAADAIRQLQDRSLRTRIVEGGTKLIHQRYSREASISAWADAVNRFLQLPVQHSRLSTRPPANGRLDKLFGTSLAETLRRLANVRFRHQSAGAEWPHSHSTVPSDEGFLNRVADCEHRWSDFDVPDLK